MALRFYVSGLVKTIPYCENFFVHQYKTFKLLNYDMFLVISQLGK